MKYKDIANAIRLEALNLQEEPTEDTHTFTFEGFKLKCRAYREAAYKMASKFDRGHYISNKELFTQSRAYSQLKVVGPNNWRRIPKSTSGQTSNDV